MYISRDVGIRVNHSYRIPSEEIEELVGMLGVDGAFEAIVGMIQKAISKPITPGRYAKLERRFIELYGMEEHYHTISYADLDDLGVWNENRFSFRFTS